MVMFFVAGATSALAERVSGRAMVVGRARACRRRHGLLTVAQVDSSWTIALPGSLAGDGRHRPVQPGDQQLRAQLGPRAPERAGGGRQRHVPPGRHRGRRRGARRADPVRARLFGGGDQSAFVGGLHDALWVCAAVCVVGAAACWALLRDPAPAEATRLADDALVAEAV